MSNNLRETKQRFTLRKNKRYKNVVSVGLGLFAITSIGVITSNEAKASDDNKVVTTENPATNYPEVQPNPTINAEESQNQTNKSTGEIEVAVDNSKLNEAVEKSKQEGLNVVQEDTQNKGTVKSVEEAEKIATEINNSYTRQVEEINKETEDYKKAKEENQKQTEQIIEENAKIKAEYDKKLADIEKLEQENSIKNEEIKKSNKIKLDEYERELAEYNRLKDEYDKKISEIENNINTEGYLQKLVAQNLIYIREQNAKIDSIKGATPITKEGLLRVEGNNFTSDNNGLYIHGVIDLYYSANAFGDKFEKIDASKHNLLFQQNEYRQSDYYATLIDENKPVEVVYSGLTNSSYKNRKISKVKYTYTASNLDGKKQAILILHEDPTETAWFLSQESGNSDKYIRESKKIYLNVDVKFYYEDGSEVVFDENSPALVSFESLNGTEYPDGSMTERVKFSGEYLPINGSSLSKHQDGWIYSDSNNNSRDRGSKFDGKEYDYKGSDKAYYAAATGIINAGKEFNFTISTSTGIWFSFNSDVKAKEVPTSLPTPPQEPVYDVEQPTEIEKPKKPEYKEIPEPPKAPTVKYHYEEYTSAPQIEKTVTNSYKEDINGKFVNKQAEVSFPLNVKELVSNREKINKFELVDNLPTGYEVNIEKTTTENKNYNVEYNKATHTIVFKASQTMLDDINKDLTSTYLPKAPVVVGTVLNDGATYLNNFKLLVNDYEVYSNTVKVITPGNTPTPETPDNSFIKPTKENTNKDGVNIDGKTVLPGSINYYKLLWDLDQYKNIKATLKDINKGFYYVEDYPEEALELDEKEVTLVDSKGEAVTGVKVENFNSIDIEEAPEEVKTMLENTNIKPKGAFQLFTATNPQEFFEKYVETGNSIIITSPMTVKKAFNGTFENKAYQIDFGNGYETNVVVNNVPKLEVSKQVIDVNGKDINNGTVALNEKPEYKLEGAHLPSNRAEEISQYDFNDDYDEKGDKYLSYKVITDVDVTLKDGRVIEKGTDITTFTEEVKEDGKVTIKLKQAFLNLVSLNSEFKANAILEMERIASGTFENTYINVVNGNEVISNTVRTTTPEPTTPTPEEPKEPEKPTTPVTPEEPVKKLSNTGIGDDYTQEAVGLGMAGLGLLALSRRRKNSNLK